MGTFVQNVKELRERVGNGKLKGYLNVNQVYAYCQHEHWWWKTKHKYLEKALSEFSYHGDIARTIYSQGGVASMIRNVEELNRRMAINAPKKSGDLSRSGSPKVYDDGRLVYSRPARTPRKPGENKGIAPHRPPGQRVR